MGSKFPLNAAHTSCYQAVNSSPGKRIPPCDGRWTRASNMSSLWEVTSECHAQSRCCSCAPGCYGIMFKHSSNVFGLPRKGDREKEDVVDKTQVSSPVKFAMSLLDHIDGKRTFRVASLTSQLVNCLAGAVHFPALTERGTRPTRQCPCCVVRAGEPG